MTKKTRRLIYCSKCNKPFERVPSDIKEINFCSNDCRADFFRTPNEGYFTINNVTHFEIKNSSGKISLVLIDTDMVDKVKPYRWHIKHNYVLSKIKNKVVRLHRFITDCPDDKVVDHLNHNTFDNRLSNLRVVTSQENSRNRVAGKNNTTGVVGVSFHKRDNKYTASIKVNQKLIHLGTFLTLEDARLARVEAENKYFPELKQALQAQDWRY